MKVTNRLRVLRAEQDWTQAVVAERLGVSRQAINAVENGKYDPSVSLALALAQLFVRPSNRSSSWSRPMPRVARVASWIAPSGPIDGRSTPQWVGQQRGTGQR